MDLHTDRMKLAEVFPDAAKTWAKRLHIKADAIDYVRKGIPIDPSDISIAEGERAAIRYVSTPRKDRDDEIMLPDGAVLDTFREAPTVLYAHDYSGLPIGKDIWIKPTKKGLLAKTVYANHQLAQDVYDCVKDGFLTSSSVGFIPVESVGIGDKEFQSLAKRVAELYGVPIEEAQSARRIYTKWILLEHSDVPVPSNAQSLNLLVGKNVSPRLKKDMGVPVADETAKSNDPETPDGSTVPPVDEPKPELPEGQPPVEFKATETAAEADNQILEAAISTDAETKAPDDPAAGATDVTLQSLSAILGAVAGVLTELQATRADLLALRDSIPLLILPAKPKPASEPEPISDIEASVPFMLADALEHIKALEAKVDGLKAVPNEPPAPVDAPVIEPPKPAPVPPTADEIKAAVADFLKSPDFKLLLKKETALSIAKLKGKVESA